MRIKIFGNFKMNNLQESMNGCTSTMNENFDKSFEIDVPKAQSAMTNQTDEHLPDIEIIFRNKDCERKYHSALEGYLKHLLSHEETFEFTLKASAHNKDEIEKMFCIDKVSSPTVTGPEQSGTIFYTSPFSSPIVCEGSAEKQKTKKGRKSLLTCFNCLGEHHLKDCPMDHDGYRIATNRKEFMEQITPTRRYHVDSEEGPSSRYKPVPGVISNELRRALGVRHYELPLYIYNMRVLGYPPGWLSEAEIETSGMMLFDSENKVEEDKATHQPQQKQYDFNKFVKYPGFNTPLPSGVRDEYMRLRMPAMQSHQMLSEAVKHTAVTTTASDVYKKKKQSFPEKETNKKQKSDCSEEESSSGSLKLASTEPESTAVKDKFGEDISDVTENANNADKKSDKSLKETSKDVHDKTRNSSVLLNLYVPIVETPNACKRLPNYNNFAEGISDHENFENLPNATGTYDQMRDILDGVRQKLFEKP